MESTQQRMAKRHALMYSQTQGYLVLELSVKLVQEITSSKSLLVLGTKCLLLRP